MKKEIPVYLFTGFLGSGKTTFIQDTLESENFLTEERTLFLVCEEGEIEYEPEKFFDTDIHIEQIEDEQYITPDNLDKLADKYDADAVIVEYNGMWMLDTIYGNMPENWYVNQEMTFIESPTFLSYNQNMRQLVFDKLKSAELVVFNRFDHAWDKLEYHKIVRVANRKSQIVYEFGPDDVEPDIFQDPLPYDMDAPVVVIKDDDYAEFYRDLNENMQNYGGKTMKIKGRAVTGQDIPDGKFVFGRHVMTCCVQDIQFAGMVCKYPATIRKPENGQWVKITGKVKIETDPIYGDGLPGPVIYCTKVTAVNPADPEVAQF